MTSPDRPDAAAAPADSPRPPAEHPGPPADHPTSEINETVHQRHRLGILTITAEAPRADFGYLREALGLTAGNLSRHLTVLEDAQLVQVEKGYEGRRPRTWVRITRQGRKALAREIATLTELVRRHGSPQADDGRPQAVSDSPSAGSGQAGSGQAGSGQ